MAPRIDLHFHPGWGFGDTTVLGAIADSGWYRSQWQTGISNGGLTAYRGGDRWQWESELFDGRYDDAGAEDRPVYGAWNRRDDMYGASPLFGSAYLRLRLEVSQRATFCWPDSVYRPHLVGGPETLKELCELADSRNVDPSEFAQAAVDLPLDDPLNDYVEAHVHGGLSVVRDVEAVVVDPTDREAQSAALDRLGCVIEEHPGYRVTATRLIPTTGALSQSSWHAFSGARSPQPDSVTRRDAASMIRKLSSGCGTASPASVDTGPAMTLSHHHTEPTGIAVCGSGANLPGKTVPGGWWRPGVGVQGRSCQKAEVRPTLSSRRCAASVVLGVYEASRRSPYQSCDSTHI